MNILNNLLRVFSSSEDKEQNYYFSWVDVVAFFGEPSSCDIFLAAYMNEK